MQKGVIYLVDIFIWDIYFLQLKTHCPAPWADCHQSQGGGRTRLSSSVGLLVPQGRKPFRCRSLRRAGSCQVLWLTAAMLHSLVLGPVQTLRKTIIIPLSGARLRAVLMKISWAGRRNRAFGNQNQNPIESSFLRMLAGLGGVCSTRGCHGRVRKGCKMHGPGCFLCDGCAIARSDSRWLISERWC